MQAHDDHTERYRTMLHELAELTLAMARQLVALATREAQDATAALPPVTSRTSPQDFALALDRVARATRRTINLARHLDQPLPTPSNPRPDPATARKQVIRTVEDAILRAQPKPELAQTLRAELTERLDSPELAREFHDDLATRPIEEIIQDIVRDLNVTPDDLPWPRRTPSDLRNLLTQATNPTPTPDPLFTATWPGPKRRPQRTYSKAELERMPDELLDTLIDEDEDDDEDGRLPKPLRGLIPL